MTIRIKGRLYCYDRPVVAGILNATPDSFFAGSRTYGDRDRLRRAADRIGVEGADIIDIGAYSSRPGAQDVSVDEELNRLGEAIEAVRDSVSANLPISVDTFRSCVARTAVTDYGADIINDISGGDLDPKMFETVAELQVPYIMMHMRGTPVTMQTMCEYGSQGVTCAVISDLSQKIDRLAKMGLNDIIVDPGFGFAKTLEQNYQLLSSLPDMKRILRRPIMAGMSRKSMLTRLLGIGADEAASATTAVNMAALRAGAAILRVHDVKTAHETVIIEQQIKS